MLISALPAGGVASLGELFKGRQFIPVEPAMTIGALDVDGGLGRTACIGREIEFSGHFFTSERKPYGMGSAPGESSPASVWLNWSC